MLHGCIPVLIQDRVEEKFSSVVDYAAFALRIAEADIEQVLEAFSKAYASQLHIVKSPRVMWLQHPSARLSCTIWKLERRRLVADARHLSTCCSPPVITEHVLTPAGSGHSPGGAGGTAEADAGGSRPHLAQVQLPQCCTCCRITSLPAACHRGSQDGHSHFEDVGVHWVLDVAREEVLFLRCLVANSFHLMTHSTLAPQVRVGAAADSGGPDAAAERQPGTRTGAAAAGSGPFAAGALRRGLHAGAQISPFGGLLSH